MWLWTTRPCRFGWRQWGKRVGSFQNLTSSRLTAKLTDETSVVDRSQCYGFFAVSFGARDATNGCHELLTVAIEVSERSAEFVFFGSRFAIDNGIEAGFDESLSVAGDLFAHRCELAHSFAAFKGSVTTGA